MILVLFNICFMTSICFAEENLFSQIEYPELQVTPRATERLSQLATLEESSGMAIHWTLLASGAMTLLAGSKHNQNYKSNNLKDSDKSLSDLAANSGILVGAGWMAWGGYLSYKKWAASRLAEIRRYPGKDKRAELTRERMAEEFLEHTAATIKTVDELAFYTNLFAGTFITLYAAEDTRVYSLLAMATSMLPTLFPNIFTLSYDKHMEYKRKIYAPLAGFTFNSKMEPMMTLNWSF